MDSFIHAMARLTGWEFPLLVIVEVTSRSLRILPAVRRTESSPKEPTTNFLGAFAKLRKATISFVMSVCLSLRMEQLGSHWKDFHEILYFTIFRNSIDKVQF